MQEHGIEPIVLTVDSKKAAYPAYDFSFLEKIKHVKVFRTSPGFNPLGFYSFLKTGNSKKNIPVGDVGGKKKSLLDKFSTFIRANFFIPDARIGWNKHALKIAKKICEEEKVSWVITTGPPHSTHLIGLEIKKDFKLHWLADFRDPWHDIYYNKIFNRTKRSNKKDLFLESEVLSKSDTLLTVGPSMRKLLISKNEEIKDKCFFIYNGYDEGAFEEIKKNKYPEFTIAHIGVWTLQQPHQEIIESLHNITNAHKELKIRFVTAGNVNSEILTQLEKIPNLILDHKGKINHREALQEMKNADLLLNCLPLMENSELLISGKLMEYIASENPILLIGNKEGDAAKLLENINCANTLEPGEINKVEAKILELIFHYPKIQIKNPNISQYSRKETCKELVNLLNKRLI